MNPPIEATKHAAEGVLPSKKTTKNTAIVLGLGLLMRALVILIGAVKQGPAQLFKNGLEMGLLAQSILGRAWAQLAVRRRNWTPRRSLRRVYPILVAAVFKVFGAYSNASALVMMSLHVLANLGTIWLVMRLARKYFNEQTAVLAGAFWAIAPPVIFLPGIFWETSFSICLLMGLLTLALRLREHPGLKMWLILGAYGGAMALVNPALLLTLIAVVAYLVIVDWRTIRLPRVGLGLLLFVLVFCAWPIRNARVFHAFVPLRTTVGFELWMGNRPGSTGFLNESLWPGFNAEEMALYKSQGEIAYTNGKSTMAKSYIEAHPARFLALSAKRFMRFWLGMGTEHGSPIFPAYAMLTTVLGFAGLWTLFRQRRWQFALLLAVPLIFFPAPYYITHAEFRYRIVIDPLMTLLGAYALVEWVKRSEASSATRG